MASDLRLNGLGKALDRDGHLKEYMLVLMHLLIERMSGFRRQFWTVLLATGVLALTPGTGRANPETPVVATLLTNVMTKVSGVQTQGFRGKYSFTRVKSMEELNDKGAVKEKDEKVYQVFPISGRPFSKLVQSDGKPLPEKERRKEDEREANTRQQLATAGEKPFRGKKELPLTLEILNRFAFEIKGQEVLDGRPMWVLTFKPRDVDLPVSKIQDRVVNKMSGTVWVDIVEFEIARADMHLLSHVNLVGGVVGTLRRLDYLMERKRLDDGVWFTAKTEADIEGRELVMSRHVRMREECTDFKKVATEKPASEGQ